MRVARAGSFHYTDEPLGSWPLTSGALLRVINSEPAAGPEENLPTDLQSDSMLVDDVGGRATLSPV